MKTDVFTVTQCVWRRRAGDPAGVQQPPPAPAADRRSGTFTGWPTNTVPPAPILRRVKRRPRPGSVNPDRLGAWLWGAVAVVVLVVVAVLVATSGDDDAATTDDPFLTTASVVSGLGAFGTTSGEGLTRPELAAATGRIDTTDGGRLVPQATVDGPGRRVFAGVTVRLPRGRQPFVLRQIVPADVPGADRAPAFVRWEGWLAVLTPAQVRAGTAATGLSWRKAEQGLEVPAGATVRLRTLFRVPQAAGRCTGASLPADAVGQRARQTLRRAPAWMVRRPGRNVQWQWLRADTQDVSGLPVAVRTGPTRPVVFRGSNVCSAPQSTVTVDPDPDPLGGGGTDGASGLPLDSPSGY